MSVTQTIEDMQRKLAEAEARIHIIVIAGDEMAWCLGDRNHFVSEWNKAKSKPLDGKTVEQSKAQTANLRDHIRNLIDAGDRLDTKLDHVFDYRSIERDQKAWRKAKEEANL